MAVPLVLHKQVGRVLHLHINSPENLNALSSALIEELSEAFSAGRVGSASVVLVTSAGRHFGAGHDLSEMVSSRYSPELFTRCSLLMQKVSNCEVPVVAAVQGCAFAAGCQLAASCDIVLAADDARFATPGIKIGLFCSTPSVAVTRATSEKVAADMLFSSRELTAAEALQSGLVSRVVKKDALLADAFLLCHRIAETPRDVLVGGKALLRAQRGLDLGRAYDLASEAMARGMESISAREGIGAFLQKRHPSWPSEEFEVAAAVALVPHGVAVVGASPDPSRPSHGVFKTVQAAGPAYPVNPKAAEVAGVLAHASLAEVPGEFAVVNVFRAAGDRAAAAVDEAIALARRGWGVRAVWLQRGVRAPEAEARARAAGLLCVADRCLATELRRRQRTAGAGTASKL